MLSFPISCVFPIPSSILVDVYPSSAPLGCRRRACRPCHDVPLDPGTGHVRLEGNLVLELARLDAEAAAHALVRVNEERPAHVRLLGGDLREELFRIDELIGRERQGDAAIPLTEFLRKSRLVIIEDLPRFGRWGLWQLEHSMSGCALPGRCL